MVSDPLLPITVLKVMMPNDAISLTLGSITRASDSPVRLVQPKGEQQYEFVIETF